MTKHAWPQTDVFRRNNCYYIFGFPGPKRCYCGPTDFRAFAFVLVSVRFGAVLPPTSVHRCSPWRRLLFSQLVASSGDVGCDGWCVIPGSAGSSDHTSVSASFARPFCITAGVFLVMISRWAGSPDLAAASARVS